MLILALLAPLAHADRYVETTGSNANDCSALAQACGTIEHALSLAGPGEVVFVGSGTFSSTATYPLSVGSGVSVHGAGRSVTQVRGDGVAPVFRLSGGSQELVDLSIHASGGDGIDMTPVADLYIARVDVDEFATGVRVQTVDGGTMTLDDSTFHSTQSSATGVNWVTASQAESLTLSNLTIDAPRAFEMDASSQAHVELLVEDSQLLGHDPVNIALSAETDADLQFLNSDIIATNDAITISAGTGNSMDLRLTGATLDASTQWLDLSDSSGSHLIALTDSDVTVGAGGEAQGLATFFHHVLDNVTVHNTSSSDWMSFDNSSGSFAVVVRDSEIDGGSLFRYAGGNERSARMLIASSTVTNASSGIYISGYSTGDFDVDIHDSTFELSAPLMSTSVGQGWMGTAHITDVQSLGGGLSFEHYGPSQTSYFLDNVTISDASVGINMLHSSTGGDATLDVRRTRLEGNSDGLTVQAYNASATRMTFTNSEISGSARNGISIGGEGGITTLDLNACALLDNASGYTVPNAYDIQVYPWGQANIAVHTRDTWFGTTDIHTIESRTDGVVDTGLDTGDTGGGVDFLLDPVGSAIVFDAHPPYGTPSGGKVLLRVPADGNLADRMGDQEAVVLFGSQPAEVISGSPHGDAIRVERGPLAPGTYDVTITDPVGRMGTLTNAYTVDASDPDTISMQHQSFVEDTRTWFRIVGPPNGVGRLYLSPEASGARACPPVLQGDCLQIPGPLAVDRRVDFQSTGIAWIRVGRPPARNHPEWVSAQVVAWDSGGQRSVSKPESWRWLDPDGDMDGDALDNLGEHDAATDPYRRDHDGDGCPDGEDGAPRMSASGSTPYLLPTDCPWYP